MEGNLRFQVDWASLWWEGNLPFSLCFTLYSRANSKYKPPRGDLSEGFLRYNFGVLIFGILRYLTVVFKFNLTKKQHLTTL